ncbi:type II secretion system F family protein [Marinobacter shengliensis]|uniref:type II secretion system F family protein n=1 Tax=Marinobacter shengliensis TaxID=1389223 RepID=UPI000D0EDCD7|nr:type II secretion system F family protein [Marinobacter shengliensis]PSF12952.1 type II secretion system protein [Marinobacter shengliensis]
MNTQLIWLLCLLAGVAAVLVIMLQLTLSRLLAADDIKKRTARRLAPEVRVEQKPSVIDLGPLQSVLLRAGFRVSGARILLQAIILLATLLAVFILQGLVEVLVSLFFVITALVTTWRVKFERQRRQIFEELPGILDGMLRSISVGRSVEQSIVNAFGDASPVFDPMVFRLKNAVSQGRDYTLVLDAFASFYQIPAFTQIAIALRTSSRFGSSVKPVLFEVAKAIRSQQELRREFMAATAETRFTAIVFAIMPPGLAVYMVVLNEQFSEKLLHSEVGHTLLMVSGGLQLLGIVMIWNLIRGVGRG